MFFKLLFLHSFSTFSKSNPHFSLLCKIKCLTKSLKMWRYQVLLDTHLGCPTSALNAVTDLFLFLSVFFHRCILLKLQMNALISSLSVFLHIPKASVFLHIPKASAICNRKVQIWSICAGDVTREKTERTSVALFGPWATKTYTASKRKGYQRISQAKVGQKWCLWGMFLE